LVQELLDELAASRMDNEAWNEKLELLEEYVEEEKGNSFDIACQPCSAEQAAELAQCWQTAKQEHMARHTTQMPESNLVRPRATACRGHPGYRLALESRIAALPGAGGYSYPLYQRDEETEIVSA